MNPIAVPDLILDVGMNDGSDTAYYLGKGYRVLAIDADPALCEKARNRFALEIEMGKLTILNVGVASEESSLTFHKNLRNAAHSTFELTRVLPEEEWEALEIRCRPLSSIIHEAGIPYYLKVDIEGYDDIAISTLTPDISPPFISVELGNEVVTLNELNRLGYNRFKLINQVFHTTSAEIQTGEFGWRILRRTGRAFPAFRTFMRSLPYRCRPRTEWDRPYLPVGSEGRPCGPSGPFGDETHGVWRDFQSTKRAFEAATARSSYIWWDVHARK
ncbi:MAG: FkbM family methyltransferase [Bryobacterales bacterium]|nr:FkbM family methyltransferase [Bryobacterales bacterium]